MVLVDAIEGYEVAQRWNLDDCLEADYEAFKREQSGAGELVAA